jgi:TRAP transporter TAXI family solute receptor
MRHLWCFLFGLVCVGMAFAAQASKPIGMVTGSKTGTYIQIGQDIAGIAATKGLPIEVKESKGSIENIRRISSSENASLGIVQSDVLGYLRRSKNADFARLAGSLKLVYPFYKEEVHILARKDIRSFADLAGKKLIVGTEGSGHWLTAMNLLAMTDVQPAELLRLAPPEAVIAVLKGRADAMVFVGGKPVKLFANLASLEQSKDPAYRALLSQVHFLPMQDPKMLGEYETSTLTQSDYPFVVGEPVPTIAVTAVLVSFSFEGKPSAYASARCGQIHDVAATIRDHMPQLQANGHPKWKEVDINRNLNIWEKDRCVDSPKSAIASKASATGGNPIEQELLGTIENRWQKPAE